MKRYEIGRHLVCVWDEKGRWTVTIDGKACSTWYMSLVEAWEAGVREADRIDRGGMAPRSVAA
jgi:hypothetical protein